MEEAALARARYHVGLDGLPRTGLARLSWQEALLRHDGVLVLRELVAQMPSGRLVVLGEDALLVDSALKLDGSSELALPIYLHLLVGTIPKTPPAAKGEIPVTRGFARLAISQEEAHPESVEHLQIALLRQDEQGLWAPAPDFLPLLLTCWGTPYLRPHLEGLEAPFQRLRSRLSDHLSLRYLEGSDQDTTRSCLKEIYTFLALLADFRAGLDQHPYQIYRQLRHLFFELFFYQSVTQRVPPELALVPYKHDDLASCVGQLLKELLHISQQEWSGLRSALFERQEGTELFTLTIPEEITGREVLFLQIRKLRVGVEFDASGLKLSARSRLNLLHHQTMRGIPMVRVPLPAFAQQLSPTIEFYRIDKEQEWKLAQTEGELAFYNQKGLEVQEAALCWGLGGGE